MLNSGKWVTVSTVFQTVLQFIQIAILARLLSPEDFGVVSISTLVINFFMIFANLGFSNSIIYKQESDRNILSSIYFLSISMGIFIYILVYCFTPLLVAFYHEPRLTHVVRTGSLMFLIMFFGSIQLFMLQKEMQFRSIAIVDILASLLGTGITIFLAVHDYKEMSLVYGGLAMQAFRTVLQIFLGRHLFRPKLYFKYSDVSEHIRFGIFNLGDGLVGFLQNNLDNIVLGNMLGVKSLGYYTLASQLAVYPINKLNPIILQVAYPMLAKIKDNAEHFKNTYIKILDLVTYCNLPLLAGLFITADTIVPLVYGPSWEQSIHLIRIFVFVSFFSCVAHPLFTIVYSKGKPNLLFYLNLATLVIKIPLLYFLGRKFQLDGIAFAYLLATLFNTITGFFITNMLIGKFFKDFSINLGKTFFYCLVMVGVIFAYKSFVGSTGYLHASFEIALGGLVYIGFTLMYKYSYQELIALRKNV